MHEIISIKKISVQRGGKPVLKNISWTTYSGEHWFLMGKTVAEKLR